MIKYLNFYFWFIAHIWLNLPRDDNHFGYKQKFLKISLPPNNTGANMNEGMNWIQLTNDHM